MLKHSKTLLLLLITMIAGFLVACGDKDSNNKKNDSGVNEDGVIELSFAAWGSPEEFEVYQKAVDSFNKEHDDIQVQEVTGIPWDNYNQTITTRLQGGQAPDVFYVNGQYISNLIATDSLLPLNDFMGTSDSYIELDDYTEDIWGPAEKKGEKYGFSVDSNPIVMFYNKDVFKETGIKTPQEYYDEGKWNWEAMEKVTNQLVEEGKYGFVQDPTQAAMLNWIWSNGGEFEVDGEIVVDKNEATKEAFEFVNKMIENGNFISGNTLSEGQGADAMLMSNQVGMINGGRWYAPVFNEANIDYDYIPWPSNTENKIEPAEIATAYLSVNSDTKHEEAAKKFASYYSSEIGQKIRLEGQGNAVPSVLGVDELVTDNPETEHVEYLLDARDIGRVVDFEVSIPGLYDELNDILQVFMIGDISVEEAIDQLASMSREMSEE